MCLRACWQASLKEMIPPGALVLLSPLVVGILFGTRTLAGLLAGALVSGVQMAVSMSNTGALWSLRLTPLLVVQSPAPDAVDSACSVVGSWHASFLRTVEDQAAERHVWGWGAGGAWDNAKKYCEVQS